MQVIQVYQAHQWHKNGDHPDDYKNPRMYQNGDSIEERPGSFFREKQFEGEVVRYFRRPGVNDDAVCGTCGKKMLDHGWLDPARNRGCEFTVCPGDWILSSEVGVRVPMNDERFKEGYREYKPSPVVRFGPAD